VHVQQACGLPFYKFDASNITLASPAGVEYGNGVSRKLSEHAVLAEKLRKSLGKPLPSGPI